MKHRKQNVCCYRNPLCRDTDYCNIKQLVETIKELKKKFRSQQENLSRDTENWVATFKEEVFVATRKFKPRHRNKLNREKHGHDRLFYVAIKIPTRYRKVLSRHNKLGRDTEMD